METRTVKAKEKRKVNGEALTHARRARLPAEGARSPTSIPLAQTYGCVEGLTVADDAVEPPRSLRRPGSIHHVSSLIRSRW